MYFKFQNVVFNPTAFQIFISVPLSNKKFSRIVEVFLHLLSQLTQVYNTLFLPWPWEVSEQGRRLWLCHTEKLCQDKHKKGILQSVWQRRVWFGVIAADGMRWNEMVAFCWASYGLNAKIIHSTNNYNSYIQTRYNNFKNIFKIHRFHLLVRTWLICILLQHPF